MENKKMGNVRDTVRLFACFEDHQITTINAMPA